MFQYAFGYSLSKKLKQELLLDTTLIKEDQLRNYSLDCFKISGSLISEKKFKSLFILPIKIIRKFNFINNFYSSVNFISESSFSFNKKVLNLRGNICLDGYWQSEKYFKDVSNEIKEEFLLNKKISLRSQKLFSKIKKTNAVSCHVRRSDYTKNSITNNIHGTCSIEWYQKCFDFILKRIKNPVFYVFSDDIEWVKSNFPNNAEFIFAESFEKGKDYEDLYLMSQCKHNIIANSSFSWWSAWLNEHIDKIVICPKNWFQIDINTEDLIPYSWINL